MLLLPAPHPGGVLRVTEVEAVVGLAQPHALTGGLACTLTLGFGAVLLPSAVAHVDSENLSTGQALGFALVRHGSPEGTACCQLGRNARQPANTAPPAEGKNAENKTIEIRCPKKTDGNKTSTFTPTDLHGNQLGADTMGNLSLTG
jgi:hypothetical protein